MRQNLTGCNPSLHFTTSNSKSQQSQPEISKPQKVKHLCDRLVFEFENRLSDWEITALSRISMLYQGKATDRELTMIADICDRLGIAGGV